MNRDEKAAVVAEIAAELQGAEAIYAVDYRGISVPQVAELRSRLRDADTALRVVKNSLTERAADEAGVEALKVLLAGPTALAFVHGDAALAAKTLNDFARANDNVIEFKGGLLGSESLDPEQLRSIARLPTRDVLYGQLVGIVASPITGLVRSLNGLISGLAIALGQIHERGLVTGEAPPAAEPQEAPAAEAQDGPAVEAETAPAPEAEEAPAVEAEDAPAPEAEAETESQDDTEEATSENDNEAEASAQTEPADDDAKED